jgi:hypothetical protein
VAKTDDDDGGRGMRIRSLLLKFLAVAGGRAGLVSAEMFRTPQGRAYVTHVILAGIVCIVLGGQIWLLITKANVSTVGGSEFLFVMILGLPSLVLFVAAVYFSLLAITDRRIILLTVALLLLAFSFGTSQSLVISITAESLYVGLAGFLALPRLLRSRNEQIGVDG